MSKLKDIDLSDYQDLIDVVKAENAPVPIEQRRQVFIPNQTTVSTDTPPMQSIGQDSQILKSLLPKLDISLPKTEGQSLQDIAPHPIINNLLRKGLDVGAAYQQRQFQNDIPRERSKELLQQQSPDNVYRYLNQLLDPAGKALEDLKGIGKFAINAINAKNNGYISPITNGNPVANTIGLVADVGETLMSPFSTSFSILTDAIKKIPSYQISKNISVGGKELADAINLPFELLGNAPSSGAKQLDKFLPKSFGDSAIAKKLGIKEQTIKDIASKTNDFNSLASILVGLGIAHNTLKVKKTPSLEELNKIGVQALERLNKDKTIQKYVNTGLTRFYKPNITDSKGLKTDGKELTQEGKQYFYDRLNDKALSNNEKQITIDYLKKQGINTDNLEKVNINNGDKVLGLLQGKDNTDYNIHPPEASIKFKKGRKSDKPLNEPLRNRQKEQNTDEIIKSELEKKFGKKPTKSTIDENTLKSLVKEPKFQEAEKPKVKKPKSEKQKAKKEETLSETDKLIVQSEIDKGAKVRDIAEKYNFKPRDVANVKRDYLDKKEKAPLSNELDKSLIEKLTAERDNRRNSTGVEKRKSLVQIKRLIKDVPGLEYDDVHDNIIHNGKKVIIREKPTEKVKIEDVKVEDKAKKSFEDLSIEERAKQEVLSDFVEAKDLPSGIGKKVVEKGKEDINKDNGKEKSKEAQLVRQAALDKKELRAKTGLRRMDVTKDDIEKEVDKRTTELESEAERKAIQDEKGDTSFNFGENKPKKQFVDSNKMIKEPKKADLPQGEPNEEAINKTIKQFNERVSKGENPKDLIKKLEENLKIEKVGLNWEKYSFKDNTKRLNNIKTYEEILNRIKTVKQPDHIPGVGKMSKQTENATKQPYKMTRDEFKTLMNDKYSSFYDKPAKEIFKNLFGKYPYELTKDEWIKHNDKIRDFERNFGRPFEISKNSAELLPHYDKYGAKAAEHVWAIEQALKDGKKVPEEVLKDYPELSKQENKKQLDANLDEKVKKEAKNKRNLDENVQNTEGDQYTLGAATKVQFPTSAKFSHGEGKGAENTPLFSQKKEDKNQTKLFQKAKPLKTLPRRELHTTIKDTQSLLPSGWTVKLDKSIKDGDEAVRGLTDAANKVIKINPDLADETTAPHELGHAGLIIAGGNRAKYLLKQNGWDGKGDPLDFSNKDLVKAHERIADKNVEWQKSKKDFVNKYGRLGKIYDYVFQKLKQFYESVSNFFKKKGFVSESKFYEDLSKGKFSKEGKVFGNPGYAYQKNPLFQSSKDLFKRLNKKTSELEDKIETPSKKVVKLESTLIKDKIRAIKQGHRLGRLDTEESLRTVKREIYNYVKKNLPVTVYNKTELSNFAKLVREANAKNIDKLMSKAELMIGEKNVKVTHSKIIKIVDNYKPNKQKGKTTPEAAHFFDMARKAIKNDEVPTTNDTDLSIYSLFTNLQDRTEKNLQEVYKIAKDVSTNGRLLFKEAENKRKEKRKALLNDLISDMGLKSVPEGLDAIKNSTEFKNKRFFNPIGIHSLGSLFDNITVNKTGLREGKFSQWYDEESQKAADVETVFKENSEKKTHETLIKTFGKNFKGTLIRDSVPKKTGIKIGDIELIHSKNALAKKYIEWNDPKGRKDLEAMGYTQQTIDKIGKYIGGKWINFGKEWQKQLEEQYPEFDKVHREVFSTPAPHIKNYVPLQVRTHEQDVDKYFQSDRAYSGFTPGSVMFRVNSTNELNYELLTDAISRQKDDQAKFLGWSEITRDLFSIIKSPKFANALLLSGNKKAFKGFDEAYRNLIRGDVMSGLEGQLTSRAISGLYRATVIMPKQVIKQFTSLPGYLFRIGAKDLTKYSGEFMLNPIDNAKWVLKNMPSIRKRSKGWDVGSIEAFRRLRPLFLDEQQNPNGKFVKAMSHIVEGTPEKALKILSDIYDMRNLTMIMTKVGDRLPILLGAYSSYQTKYKEFINKGFSESEAKRKAILFAENVTNQTQQTPEWKDRAIFEQAAKNKWSRIFTVFTQATILNTQNIINSRNLWKTAPAMALKMAIAYGAVNALYAWASNPGGENIGLETVKSMTNLPLLNKITSPAINAAEHKYFGNDLFVIAPALNAIKDLEKGSPEYLQTISELSTYLGIPTVQLERYVKRFNGKNLIGHLLSYSDSQLKSSRRKIKDLNKQSTKHKVLRNLLK